MIKTPSNSCEPRRRVAVVVPLSRRTWLTPDEETSLRHLNVFLARHDKYIVVPKSLDVVWPGFGVKRFPDRFFGSRVANTRLMLSRRFYATFSEYEYILIYHLDALAFSDQLEQWCDMGFDYIGAPWVEQDDAGPRGFLRVGNGGFSLRKVQSFLRVLNSDKYVIDPDHYWRKYFADKPWPARCLNWPRKHLKRLRMFNNVRREAATMTYNEDYFWSDQAVRFDPDFKVAPVEMGLRFAFEAAPRFCFEQNGRTLPFGGHAWPVYDRSFWEPHLLV